MGKARLLVQVPTPPWRAAERLALATAQRASDLQLESPVDLELAGWTADPQHYPLSYAYDLGRPPRRGLPLSRAGATSRRRRWDRRLRTSCLDTTLSWTPLTEAQTGREARLSSLPVGNLTIRGVVSDSLGAQSCVYARVMVAPINRTLSEGEMRSAIEGSLSALLGTRGQGATNASLRRQRISSRRCSTSSPRPRRAHASATPAGGEASLEASAPPWRQYTRSLMLSVLASAVPGPEDAPRSKLLHAQSMSSVTEREDEVTPDAAAERLQLVRRLVSAMGEADAYDGVQGALLASLGDLARTDTSASPPPPPPEPPPPPCLPSPPSPPVPAPITAPPTGARRRRLQPTASSAADAQTIASAPSACAA